MRSSFGWLFAVVIAASLIACGGGNGNEQSATQAAAPTGTSRATAITGSSGFLATANTTMIATQAAAPNVQVVFLQKVSETRVSRTVYDYVFSVTFRNDGIDQIGLTASINAAGLGTTVIDGTVLIGDMKAGETRTPSDTITLRQDRTQAFQSSALAWSFVAATVPGILFPGAASDPAESHLQDFTAARSAADMETMTVPPSDAIYYRKQITATIKVGATVGEVNAALNSIGGRIGFILRNSRVITIQVPDSGSLPALEGLASSLVASGAFEVAHPDVEAQANELPANVTQSEATTAGGPVFHHLAARLAPVWNARRAQQGVVPVEVIVVDYFGDGAVAELGGIADGFATGKLCSTKSPTGVVTTFKCQHGYHVLGIIEGNFGGTNTAPGRVTGGLTFPLKVHVIDLTARPLNLSGTEYVRQSLVPIVTASPTARFVMNMSLGACSTVGSCLTETAAKSMAQTWRTSMRTIWPTLPVTAPFDYDSQLVQVTSAGNSGPTAKASLNSAWNAAVLMGTLGSEASLSNGLVVESRDVTLNTDGVPQIGPLSSFSTIGGNIAAVGQNVYSFLGSSTSAGDLSGTSMSSPQVASVVATMLAIRPALPNGELLDKTIKQRFVADSSSAPAIDAYAALLSLDKSMSDAPVRAAILKASSTGSVPPGQLMDMSDVLLFLKAYFPTAYGLPAQTLPMFSRFDLNGDGFDGDATKRRPFDLEFNGSISGFTPSLITAYTSTGNPPIDLNESAVTDFEILCYYVNSPLFTSTQRVNVETELSRISADATIARTISCSDPKVTLQVNSTNNGWAGLPAKISLTNFVLPFPATFAGNSSTCTNQGQPAGERGAPLYSASVSSGVLIQSALDVAGMPSPANGGAVNRRNCSSFFANGGAQVWINATGRAVFGFGSVVVSDWEYQIRYTNGLNGSGSKCTFGVVPNSNFFSPSFEAANCTHSVTASVAQ